MENQNLPFGYDSKVYELTIDGIEYEYRLSTPFYIEILEGFQYKFKKSRAKKMMEQIKAGSGIALSEFAEFAGTEVDSNESTIRIFIKPKDETKSAFRWYFLKLIGSTHPNRYYFMKIGEVLSAMKNQFADGSEVYTWSCFSNLVYDASDETCIKHDYYNSKVIKRIEYGSTIPEGYIPFFIDSDLNVWIMTKEFIGVFGLCPF